MNATTEFPEGREPRNTRNTRKVAIYEIYMYDQVLNLLTSARGPGQRGARGSSNFGNRSLKILSCISWFHFLILLYPFRGAVSLSHGETGVAGDVAADEGGQHPGLDLEHPAVGHAITEDRVGHLGRLALLVGLEEDLPALVVELAGVAPGQEIGRRQHAVVDQVQNNRVGDDRAELLHQVKGQ